VHSVWPTQGGQRENSNDHRFATIKIRQGSTPKFKTENWRTVRERLSLNPHLTWVAVVDLTNFFFQLGLHFSAGRWISCLVPSCWEDIAPPRSSSDLVCGRYSHFGPESEFIFNKPRNYYSNMRRRKSSPAHIAGIAVTLLDLQKGNGALQGLEK